MVKAVLLHCPSCGDAIDLPEDRLPFRGNCPYCAAEIRLTSKQAVEPPPDPPPPPPPPIPRRVTPPAPAAKTNWGGIGLGIAIVVIVIARGISSNSTKRSYVPPPRIEVPKVPNKYVCWGCQDTGKTACNYCNVWCSTCRRTGTQTCTNCPGRSCPRCRRPCLACQDVLQVDCRYCKQK